MIEQNIVPIEISELLHSVDQLKKDGYRLSQICCTRTSQAFELSYSFDKNLNYHVLRIVMPSNEIQVPSISQIYFAAFLYENEIHDLFGIPIADIAVDYKGNLYKVKTKFAFAVPPPEPKKSTVKEIKE